MGDPVSIIKSNSCPPASVMVNENSCPAPYSFKRRSPYACIGIASALDSSRRPVPGTARACFLTAIANEPLPCARAPEATNETSTSTIVVVADHARRVRCETTIAARVDEWPHRDGRGKFRRETWHSFLSRCPVLELIAPAAETQSKWYEKVRVPLGRCSRGRGTYGILEGSNRTHVPIDARGDYAMNERVSTRARQNFASLKPSKFGNLWSEVNASNRATTVPFGDTVAPRDRTVAVANDVLCSAVRSKARTGMSASFG
mmetsp:Transcript_5319/g.19391  ORF Transcript_5319/g.19391 Transcript_5319/m.19391 type:complete len:260 (-) Transcript_5319:2176-2955(-)